LHGDRLIEAELLPKLGDVPCVGGAGFASKHVGHVAGSQMQKKEVEYCDADDGQDGLGQPADEEPSELEPHRRPAISTTSA